MCSGDVIVGIDGGGTHTRVMVSDLAGKILAYCEKDGASIYHTAAAAANVQGAIAEALAQADRKSEQVTGLTAGIAGYDAPSDLEWIVPLTDLPGLACPKWHINDAWIAHYGALLAAPGIIVISGTGSIIAGINEEGRQLSNYDFHHYARSAARFIAYDAVYELLAGNRDDSDDAFLAAVLRYWQVGSLAELSAQAQTGFLADREARNRQFSRLAPLITEAAGQGSSVAIRVCTRAVEQIKVGIELLGAAFTSDCVNVALIGSVVNSPFMLRTLREALKQGNNMAYRIADASLPPVAGAVLYAMNQLKQPITDEVIRNLQQGLAAHAL
jgi:glucosamine kinase